MRENELKYTSLTVEDILSQVYDKFQKTPDGETNHKFDNFRESAIAQTLIEVFAGVVDINNYYIQRRAEECYYDTAQLKSSVISLSRMFGYVMNRREPSHANLRMIIEGDIEDNQVQIPYYSKFSYDGYDYVLVNTMTYRMPNDQYNLMDADSVIKIDADSFDAPIEIVQGTIKEKVFNGATNTQTNAPFQIYKIEDKTFSNVYGETDFFYNDVAQVYVGDDKNEANRFKIDRRSLLNWENIYTSNLSEPAKICVLRTTPDGDVDLLFGDGQPNTVNTEEDPQATGGFTRKGAITKKDNIYVQYLSCEGKSTNVTGVIGDNVDFGGQIYNSNGKDITDKISFELITNVYGGADDESMDSIKYSSPKIYYSLDRLVAKGDYIAFLKSLTTPINVRNAVVWGEQEERELAFKFALSKMFNVALFSVTGSLYDLDAQPHIAKQGSGYNDVVLDLNYNPYEFQTQGYFNVFIIQEMVNQLKRYNSVTTFYEINGELINHSVDYIAIADVIKNKINTSFPNGTAPVSFKYGSSKHEYVSNITAGGTVEVKGLNTFNNEIGEVYLQKVAEKVNEALLEFNDVRGNKIDNDNFNKQAFFGRWPTPPELFKFYTWDSSDDPYLSGFVSLYRLKFNEEGADNTTPTSPCIITEFDEANGTLLDILGLNGQKSSPVSVTEQKNQMNGKISQVVNDLSERSQVNVKNIYVSPIIHRFILEGDIYVKSLYDATAVRDEITNELYQWLDINADFNIPLNMTDIKKLVDGHIGVINSNIRLVPEDITAGKDNTHNLYYDPNPVTNEIYNKYTQAGKVATGSPVYRNTIAELINTMLAEYISSGTTSTANEDWYRGFITGNYLLNPDGSLDTTGSNNPQYINTVNEVESYKYTVMNVITERSFYRFAGDVYEALKLEALAQKCDTTEYICPDDLRPNYALFIGLDQSNVNTRRSDTVRDTVVGTDFSVIMEEIHKDLSYIIMKNMLDTHGNIDIEYNEDNEYVSGGYTLGSEIVQVLLDESYLNSKEQSVKFLKAKYK